MKAQESREVSGMDEYKKDRRAMPRRMIIIPVRIRGDGLSEGMFYTGLSKDISMKGIRLETVDELSVGTKFIFEIFLPNKKCIKPKGKIVWSKVVENIYYYGVEFYGVNIFDKIRLAKHIRILGKAE